MQETRGEEFSDWPQGLLAIGTFGIHTIREEDTEKPINHDENPSSSDRDEQDENPEEVGNLQRELKSILSHDEQVDQTSLEVDQTNGGDSPGYLDGKDGILQRSNSVVRSRGQDARLDNTKGSIGKRSVAFLLKKMFVCTSGFGPAPSLRDPIPESRMEKVCA